jgi:hypothetical protein
VGFPEENHILGVGIDSFIDIIVEGGIVEIDRAVLSEVAMKERVKFIEEFISEVGVLCKGTVNIFFETGF